MECLSVWANKKSFTADDILKNSNPIMLREGFVAQLALSKLAINPNIEREIEVSANFLVKVDCKSDAWIKYFKILLNEV
ncbi:MAG: hypothetical protein H0W50_09585 [Parachlamydiaceae bacterium]|nr:hypothetical protein [Parachlamydiaceae bacterium]